MENNRLNEIKKKTVDKVFNSVFQRYDLMNDLMSFGVHRLWKKNLIDWLMPKENTKLIDMAGGTGDVSKLFLEKTKYRSEAYLIDQNINMISQTNSKINSSEKFFRICSSAENIPFPDNTFDYYTISFGIRNVTDIKKSISEAFRVLKYNGRFLCLEFSKIENFYVKKLYEKYSKLLPYLGKLILGKDKPYTYLVESIDQFYNQNDLLEILNNSGFQNIKYRNLMSGIAAIHSGWKI